MKFLNLKRKLRNSALAVLFAVAVMFVMPAAVFADDTDVIDNDISTNAEADIKNENNNNENYNTDSEIDDIDFNDSEIDFNAEPSDTTEDFVDSTEDTESEIIDTLLPNDNCHGICCEDCDENCDGTCCDRCTIDDTDDIDVPDNSEYEFGDDFTADTDTSADVDSEIDNGSEEDGLDNSYGEVTDNSTDEFTNSNENNKNIIPAIPIPGEPILPYDDNDNNNNGVFPENPEYVYKPESGNEPTDDNLTEDIDKSPDNEDNEFEEEIIYGDDDLTDDEMDETSDDLINEDFDSALDEDEENSDEEDADSTADEENNEDSDDTADESDTADIDDDSENSESVTDEEISDSESSDDMADEDDDSDGTADEDNSDDTADEEASDEDDSESEALEDDNPVINVVLPASISVVVNPYNLKTNNGEEFCYSILSPEYAVKNYSNCDVSIVATVTASTTGGIVLSPNSLSGNETDFMAFVYLEATNKSNVYSDYFNGDSNQLAFSNETMTKEILTLANGANGETIGYFRIKGDAVLPVGKQCSDQAMINMLITFDIRPVGKVVASDDEVDETENVGNTEDFENTDSIENTENTDNTEGTESTDSIENTENTDNTEGTESTDSIENAENTDNTEDTESTDSIENAENIDNTESIESTDNIVEDVQEFAA